MIRRYRKPWEYLSREVQSNLKVRKGAPREAGIKQSPEGWDKASKLKGCVMGAQRAKVIYPSV